MHGTGRRVAQVAGQTKVSMLRPWRAGTRSGPSKSSRAHVDLPRAPPARQRRALPISLRGACLADRADVLRHVLAQVRCRRRAWRPAPARRLSAGSMGQSVELQLSAGTRPAVGRMLPRTSSSRRTRASKLMAPPAVVSVSVVMEHGSWHGGRCVTGVGPSSTGAPITRCVGESGVSSSGGSLQGLQLLEQAVVLGVRGFRAHPARNRRARENSAACAARRREPVAILDLGQGHS